MTFPELYEFQKRGKDILCELTIAPRNLLVSSATGSGKTKIIEFGVDEARACGRVALVAEPLVALAAQIHKRVRSAGYASKLVTGTVKKDCEQPSAVIYTYEALVRASEEMDDIFARAFAVFIDEFHYIATDRGAAIQEILNFALSYELPIVVLSGTIPNATEVARFLTSLNNLHTEIIGTHSRPVPLHYFAIDVPSNEILAISHPEDVKSPEPFPSGLNTKQELLGLLAAMKDLDRLPCLVVGFSCERLGCWADWAASVDFLPAQSHKYAVRKRFKELEASLTEEDRPLLRGLLERATRGIFTHYSHLPTPYLEFVCQIAEMKCAMVVFCTSTLSAGINLPVRTVILAEVMIPVPIPPPVGGCRMHLLDALLFNQIAGRAGRPGFEANGFVYVVHRCHKKTVDAFCHRSLPDVRPSVTLAEADVLRALRKHRAVEVDAASFANPTLAKARKDHQALVNEVLKKNHPSCTVGAICADLISLRPSTLHRYISIPGNTLAIYQTGGALFFTGERKGVVLRVNAKKKHAVPLDYVEEVEMIRTMVRKAVNLYESSNDEEGLQIGFRERWAKIAMLDTAAVSSNQDTFPHLYAKGYVTRDGVLTQKGIATCELRTPASPHAVMEAFLSEEKWTVKSLIELASASLQSGRPQESQRAALSTYSRNAFASEDSHIELILGWSKGESLADLWDRTGVPPGPACRAITRTHSVLLELNCACSVLALVVGEIEEATAKIKRGLPFIEGTKGSDPTDR